MKFKNILALLVMAIFVASAAVAQEAAAPVKEEKPKASVSGVLFFDYSYLMEAKDKVTDAKEKGLDSMNLTRAYVTFKNKISDVWSVKVTLDGGTLSTTQYGFADADGDGKFDTGETETVNTIADSSVFVKNAYAEMKQDFGAADLKIQFGMVGTPVIGLLDGLGGSRWIYNNYVDKSKDLSGKSIDISSADTGIKADMNIMKMVTVTGMYSNSDGYKTNTSDQDAVTKSYYGVLNINPIKPVNVFGYYHWHDTAGDADKNYLSYYGFGAAWKDKAIKVGGAYTIASGKAADVKEESSVLQFWVNVNLNQFVGMPVLIIGRYAMADYEKKATSKVKGEGSTIWAGLGYQANDNVQFAVMYNTSAYEKKTGSTKNNDIEASTIYVKSEAKF